MICTDFLAGAHIASGNPKIPEFSMLRLFRFLPATQGQDFCGRSASCMNAIRLKRYPACLGAKAYRDLRKQVLERDGWRCQSCGSLSAVEVHHQRAIKVRMPRTT